MSRGGGHPGRGPAGRGRGRGSPQQPARDQAGSADAGAPSPALLTSYIKKAWTIEALFETFSRHEGHFNHIHLSATWNALGHLARAAKPSWPEAHGEALESLVRKTIRTASTCAEIRARQLANIAHGAAKTGIGRGNRCVDVLMKALSSSLRSRLGDCNAQELANVAWAFAKTRESEPELFEELARAAEWHLESFNAQELANTAWAFATVGHADAQLFEKLARVIEQRLGDFTPQGLANTAWAFAKAGHMDAQLFKAMGGVARQGLDDFNAQDLANTAWAFAKAGQFDTQLFTALARAAADWHLDKFSAQGLATTMWAFAKAGLSDHQGKLFTAFASSVQQRGLGDFNSQDLANTAWAFAKACHPDGELFTALARSAERILDDFNSQDAVNTAWAFAKIGHLDAELFGAIANLIRREQRLDDLSAPLIANVAWAFAKAGQADERLFTALARSAAQRVGDFSASDLATIAWAFANAGQCDAELFTALARAAQHLLDDFTDEELDNTEWAFARAGERGIAKRLRQRRGQRGAGAAPLGAALDMSSCGRIVVAGGGIGGAALAVALQSKGFEVVVLESDASFDARKQGYGLTIQGYSSTTQALGINLADDDAPSTSHYTFSAEGHILGFFGEAFGSKSKARDEKENSGRFIHIPRQKLRSRIVDQVRPGTILWNSRLKNFRCWAGGGDARGDRDGKQANGVTVTLTDGRTLDAALLIGSDGIFSSVRRQLNLPGDRLNFVGLIVVLGIVQDEDGANASATSAAVPPLAQRRIFETVDGTTRIYAMPFTTNSTMWQLSFPFEEEAARTLVKDTAALKSEILQRCGGWHEPIPDLIRSTPLGGMAGYPVYDREPLDPGVLRPAGAASKRPPQPQRRVTLIGDAAHPMTPFKAQGANQALSDAVLLADTLAESIQKHGDPDAGIDAALPIFEKKMLSRSARIVQGSREKAKELHCSLALQPARKVQREVGVDMQKVIEVLRAKGVGAQRASDPRGLDAVVAEAIDSTSSLSAPPQPESHTATSKDKKRKRSQTENLAGTQPEKRRKQESAPPTASSEAPLRLWGYFDDDWHKCVLLKTQRSGKQKVEWEDGTISILDADCTLPRCKKVHGDSASARKKRRGQVAAAAPGATRRRPH